MMVSPYLETRMSGSSDLDLPGDVGGVLSQEGVMDEARVA